MKSLAINRQIKLPLNGANQYISIRSEQENAPLLLYLHGGPGDAALPLVLKFNQDLEKYFTVAVWEQRGAGKSYYKFQPGGNLAIDTFVQDLLELARWLLERFRQEKLYLVGHSWGSVLGLRFIQKYPQYVQAYIGCGQVVNMKKSCQTAYNFALEHSDGRVKQKLTQIDCSYTGENWLNDLLFVTGQVVKHGGSLYGRKNYNSLIAPFLFSKEYGVSDFVNRQKGGLQSIRFLWPELMRTDFESTVQFEVPVIFAEGRHDRHVSSDLVKKYYDSIQSEKHFVWFEKSCHFPQWSENDKFNRLMIDLARFGNPYQRQFHRGGCCNALK